MIPMREALYARIAERVDDLIELTQALIRIPTVNPPGDAYRACAELIGERLARRGFTVQYLRAEGAVGDSERYPRVNVVARHDSGRPGPCVHINGHIDVVTPGAGWSVDPFGGEVRDGRIYGRGSCDMKGGLAAGIVALETLLDAVPALPGSVEVSGTVDEESGGYGGVAFLARAGYFSRPRVDHVIIPEPLDVDRVCLGHRGVWWAEVETLGRIAHGSMPFLGESAIRHMGAFMAALEDELYPRLASRSTQMPVVPEGARQSTLNLNSIHGGLGEEHDGLPSPLVADSCRLVLDRRFLIEEDLTAVQAEVRDILEALARERPGFRYRLREIMAVQPTMTEPDAPVVRAVDAEIRTVLGRESRHVVSPGTYDQKHIARLGHLHDCIAYGPGILDLAHQPDEYVLIEDLQHAAQVMAGASLRLLTGDLG